MKAIYSERMNAPMQALSPSAAKPAAVMAAWRAEWPALEVRPPQPVTVQELCLAHERSFVEDVLAGRRPNGFGNRDPAVAASLPWTSGALLSAARWALDGAGIVAAPVSGFHHAGWDKAADFCTFNGLMVTALALRADRPGLRVGILDYDYHYGDGTEDILDRVGREGITHITAGEEWMYGCDPQAFLAQVESDVARLADTCDVVLYQAGADPHVDDPLGGFLDTAQMAMRDLQVFSGLHSAGVPVAWVLAGGYQEPLQKVVQLHVNTMRMVAEVMGLQSRP
ncbi:hypothetical protein [Arenimonas fontis]|jgi:acetoin utilization deacetylase AcuC-like enzyme|uniref:Histone deacetylase domain-containing protein n=1 Tax=Arenimonas fontis TaxID=2608255 RepID=A0A5B2ZAJ9_9GAMM|nr:hypothetical protein [Arenimonas fontis]KAA2284330.1 hypothetical protein F0415_09690 [Arenimonas fontis]